MNPRLPWTAKDVFALAPKEWAIFNGAIAFARATGLWRYPIETSGDLETMTEKDKIYWLYKARFPTRKAVRGSGLEDFFRGHEAFRWELPPGFVSSGELTVSAVGDLMDHPFLPNSSDYLYEDVADEIFGADLSMANLECVVHSEGTGSFTIRSTEAPPLYYRAANFRAASGTRESRYSFMATACNHSLDCGEAGVASTIRALRAEGIAFHGMNEEEQDAVQATVVERKGFKIGLLSQTFGLNAKRPPTDKPWLVNRMHLNGKVGEIDFGPIERQLRWCRDHAVDAVVAQLHWGLEHEYFPRPAQLEVAHHLAELGCDVVLGHHPHVVQPMECYRTRRDPDRVVPIYYSLGNLLTPFLHPAFRHSHVARITLAKGATKEGVTRTYVANAGAVLVRQEVDENAGRLRLVRAERDASRPW